VQARHLARRRSAFAWDRSPVPPPQDFTRNREALPQTSKEEADRIGRAAEKEHQPTWLQLLLPTAMNPQAGLRLPVEVLVTTDPRQRGSKE
jgi:hypothetical protein